MTTNDWWMLVAAALLLGVAAGSWVAFRVTRQRFSARLRHTAEDLKKRHAATADQLRAAQVRSQTELEQARSEFQRKLVAAASEPRAAAVRAEERLRAAYDELDRLRRAGKGPDTGSAELADGFAATRPMHDKL